VRIRQRIYIVLVVGLIFSGGSAAFGQKKGDVSLGMGFPELASISVRYKLFDQVRAGLSTGFLPDMPRLGKWDNLFSLSGDFYYHFGRFSYSPDKRLFYVKLGMNCILQQPYEWDRAWWNSCFRVGGEIFTTRNFGLNLEGGFICNLNPERNWAHVDRFLPAINVNLFHRF
jgi:hypothetical protein